MIRNFVRQDTRIGASTLNRRIDLAFDAVCSASNFMANSSVSFPI